MLTPNATSSRSPELALQGQRLRATLFFLHLWAVVVAVPLWLDGPMRGNLTSAALPFVFFAIGIAGAGHAISHTPLNPSLGPVKRPWYRLAQGYSTATCLLLGVPLAIALHVIQQQQASATALLDLGFAGLLLATFALWSYAAAALKLSLPDPTDHAYPNSPLAAAALPTPRVQLWRSRMLCALFGAVALAVGQWAPWPADSSQATHAADQLAAMAGAVLAILTSGLFLSKVLNPVREKSTPSSRTPTRLAMACCGVITYYLTSRQFI